MKWIKGIESHKEYCIRPKSQEKSFRGSDIWAGVWMEGWFTGGANGKEPPCQCRRNKRCGFDPWVGKMPWRRAWPPTPIFLLRESHGQRSLVDTSLQGSQGVRHDWSDLVHAHTGWMERGKGSWHVYLGKVLSRWQDRASTKVAYDCS